MPELMRPTRSKRKGRRADSSSAKSNHNHRRFRHQRKKPRRFLKWFFYLTLIVCVISAAPMVALRYYNPPTSSFIELNKANHNRNIKHQWRDLEHISAYFPVAVIASEDQQFPHHYGFDLKQINIAINESKDGSPRGASTITQQTVKNLFLWPDRSFVRKGLEAWLTLWMELIVPKERILELYVNFAQFGKSVFGVGAASEYYFNVPASQLTPHQSALIAAVLPTPSRSNPAKPSKYLLERAAIIEDQMPRIGGRRLISEL